MTLNANSYSSIADVSALVPRYAVGGTFTDTTRPQLAQVERWINQVSGLVNAVLAAQGFAIPVTQADAVLSLSFFVSEEVAAMCEGVNGSGRFGPTTKSGGGKGRFALLMEDVQAFIEANAIGFEHMGATRTYTPTSGVGFRELDGSGETVYPIFQRAAYGAGADGDNAFIDWDAER
jgi:hypothetical protein